jgi:hypothetical protein
VLKIANTTKSRQVERLLSDALRTYLSRVPFLEVLSIKQNVTTRAHGRQFETDVLAEVKAGADPWTLVAECKSLGQPREVRTATLQLDRYLATLGDRSRYGIVLAPFISEESARICTDAGVGYLDLSGNARLSFDRVFIESRAPENALKRKRELKSLFFPKSLRVLRVMLTGPLRPWKVTELAEAARVSLGHVSNVRRQLLSQEWATVRDRGLELNRPEELLREWQTQGRRPISSVQGRQLELFTLDRPGEFESKLAKASLSLERRCALTEMAAAARMAPMVRYFRTRAYVDSIDAVSAALGIKPVDSGANVVLTEPTDDGVFYDLRNFGGVFSVCPVQVYADLPTGGGRYEEAAAALLQQVIQKEWRPAIK